MRRKRDSRRRWKARANLGRRITRTVIVEHRLENWGEWQWALESETALQVHRRLRGMLCYFRVYETRYPLEYLVSAEDIQ